MVIIGRLIESHRHNDSAVVPNAMAIAFNEVDIALLSTVRANPDGARCVISVTRIIYSYQKFWCKRM